MTKTIKGNKLTADCWDYEFQYKSHIAYVVKEDIYNEDGLLAKKGQEVTEDNIAEYKELHIEQPHKMTVHIANGYPGAPCTELGIDIHTRDIEGNLIKTLVYLSETQVTKIVDRFSYTLKENKRSREYEEKEHQEYMDRQTPVTDKCKSCQSNEFVFYPTETLCKKCGVFRPIYKTTATK